jgi:hypothetical protein
MIQAVVLFLLAMGALALWSRFRRGPRIGRAKCPSCGRHRIGNGPCPCGKGA